MVRVLDMTAGSRMMWFDPHNTSAVFVDNRTLDTELCDGRRLEIKPDIIADFRALPFSDDSFDHVVFDPPHLESLGASSWRDDLAEGFSEGFRVLKSGGTLVFKWNETQIPTHEVISLAKAGSFFMVTGQAKQREHIGLYSSRIDALLRAHHRQKPEGEQ